MVFAYAIISRSGNPNYMYIDLARVTEDLQNHLNGVEMRQYTNVMADIKTFSDEGKTIWISPMSSFAIYNSVSNKVCIF